MTSTSMSQGAREEKGVEANIFWRAPFFAQHLPVTLWHNCHLGGNSGLGICSLWGSQRGHCFLTSSQQGYLEKYHDQHKWVHLRLWQRSWISCQSLPPAPWHSSCLTTYELLNVFLISAFHSLTQSCKIYNVYDGFRHIRATVTPVRPHSVSRIASELPTIKKHSLGQTE